MMANEKRAIPLPSGAGGEAPLEVRLFGPIEVRLHGVPLPRPRTRKGQWLLALLAMRAGRTVERAWLAGTLWPDGSPSQALASLRMCLADLRRALGAEAGRLRSPTTLTLCLDLTGATVDVVAFDSGVTGGSAADRCEVLLPALEQAVALYRGPLLEGCAEEWAFQERQSREQAYLTALETLAHHALTAGNPGVAERHLRQAVAVDPLRETAQRALMQAQAAGGNYAAALQTYRELRLRLHRELNAEPDAETTTLFQQIRAEAQSKAALGASRLGLGEGVGQPPGERAAVVLTQSPERERSDPHLPLHGHRGEHPALGGAPRGDAGRAGSSRRSSAPGHRGQRG